MTTRRPALWTSRHLDLLVDDIATTAPVFDPTAVPRILPDHDLWDLWPVQDESGPAALIGGHEVWMALSAPALGHPEERHDQARIRLLARNGDGWRDLGHAFADNASPGSREWSGSAVRRSDGTVSVFYTAAGRRGETRPTFRQSVVETRLSLQADGDRILLHENAGHREILRSDGRMYLPVEEADGSPGNIRAFRDPGWFRDPADGRDYLLIAASTAWDDGFTGAIALAAEPRAGSWSLLPPLLVAKGINHELERPHVIVHQSWYYLFFTTQRHTFHPADRAPTGLYGFAAPSLTGPYEPLNGSGLVIQNPAAEPDQAYAWLVLPDLHVVSFANYRAQQGTDLRHAETAQARAHFGGTVAPMLKLGLDGTATSVSP
ncbi:glycoside hydrolase family 68 protein [Nonomuraea sp. NPDC050786]|uniref:glycoside hydrolase family 68 protein n=1 Tax=Nonomuraea sp. NPDC050786 TaxID=3154840 RepID=UPI00340D45AB